MKTTVCLVTGAIIVVGFALLIQTLYQAATGQLVARYFPDSPDSWAYGLFALGLKIPIPFHVMAIGLIIQKRWLSPRWARFAWVAIVGSGCWLAVSLVARMFL